VAPSDAVVPRLTPGILASSTAQCALNTSTSPPRAAARRRALAQARL